MALLTMRGTKYYHHHVFLSVCLLKYISKHIQTLQIFLYMSHVAMAQSSADNGAIHYVLPVLWATCCIHITGHIQITCSNGNRVRLWQGTVHYNIIMYVTLPRASTFQQFSVCIELHAYFLTVVLLCG